MTQADIDAIAFNPPLELKPIGVGQTLRFETASEIIEFAQNEIKAWNVLWDRDVANGSGMRWIIEEGQKRQQDSFNVLLAKRQDIINARDDRSINNSKEHFINSSKALANSKFIYSESPFGKYIIEISKSNKSLAGAKVSFYHGVKIPVPISQTNSSVDLYSIINAAFSYQAHSLGWTGNLEGERASFENLREYWDKELFSHASNHDQAVQHITSARDQIDMEHARQKEEHEQLLVDSRKRVADLEALYLEKLRLEAPAKYWREKAAQHDRTAWIAFGTLALFGIVTVGTVVHYAPTILDTLRGKDGQISLGAVALAGPVAFITLYFFRLLMRIFTHNQTGAADARQRRALIYTYLSLVNKKNGAVTDHERLLILQALFRSSQAAAEEDTPPANLIDLMMKASEAGKK